MMNIPKADTVIFELLYEKSGIIYNLEEDVNIGDEVIIKNTGKKTDFVRNKPTNNDRRYPEQTRRYTGIIPGENK